jgi:hypothetical protein
MKSVLYILLTFLLFWLLLGERIPQNHNYHHFADRQMLYDIPNFWNVVSNAGFVLLGVWGFFKMKNKKSSPAKKVQLTMSIAIFLTGFGSAYYHYNPNNFTLIADRIPMTIVFASFFILVLYRKLEDSSVFTWYLPLLAVSAITVLYWYISEQKGEGDLRPYAIVQYFPILITGYFLTEKSFFQQNKTILWAILFYALAKIFEYLDLAISENFAMSGHPLKHFSASISCWFLIKWASAKSTKLNSTSETKKI